MRKFSTGFGGFLIVIYFLTYLPAYGAIFNPTTTQELIDDIQTANSNMEADVINLVPGMVYTITGMETGVPFNDGANGNNGLPIILPDGGNSLTVNGNGATIERDPALFLVDPCDVLGLRFRIFQVNAGADLTLSGVTLQNGCGIVPGGGAIVNIEGSLTITNSAIAGNEALNIGGGIFNLNGTMTITNSTVADNIASFAGGGIDNEAASGMSALLEIKNSLIVSNTGLNLGPNCFNTGPVTLTDNGGNISDDNTDACAFAFNSDWDTATMLGPLQYNGGGTLTRALIETMMPSNPAIDAITPADCTDQQMMPAPITDDQRFFPRPFNTNCDVGAFELQPTGMLTIEKITVPPGGTDFDFLGTGFPEGCPLMDTFVLNDAESLSCILPVDIYSVEEEASLEYELEIECTEFVEETETGVNVGIDNGDDVKCTFTNTRDVTLNLTIAGNGTGTVLITPPGETCEPDCEQDYDYNTVVTFSPLPGAFSEFSGFSGDADCADQAVTMDNDKSCTATFTLMQFLLTVTTSGTGDGTVTAPAGAGDGIDCGDGSMNCDELYDATTMVTLTAAPDASSDFTGWSGDCSAAGMNPMATVTMDAAKSCNAEFTLKEFTLNINLAGTGVGNVSAPGINCGDGGADCMETYDIGTVVNLTPTPDAVSEFVGFSGDPDCADGMVTMDANKTCTATFNYLPLLLDPIFPGIASNPNLIRAKQATPGGPVAFLWGFMQGSTIVGGATCNGLELGIKNPRLLGIRNAGINQIAELIVYIPLIGDFEFLVYTQAVDIPTCRDSIVIKNIIRKE